MSGLNKHPTKKNKKLIIVGDSAFAEVAWDLFTHESDFEVICFSVEKDFLTKNSLLGLPVIPLEELNERFNHEEFWFYTAIVYSNMNRLRTRLYKKVKDLGFKPASFISPKAYLAPSSEIGEHCFIFEDNTIQSFSKIGNNVVLWSGNHIGHHSFILDNVFVSSHVVISGFCEIGTNSFLGVNAEIANNVKIGSDNWISPGVTILKDTAEDTLVKSSRPNIFDGSALNFFGVME